MDLLREENPEPKKTKKIILMLLILSIIAVIITVVLMMYLANKPEEQIIKKDKIFVDQQEKTMPVGEVLLVTAQGEEFLAIKELAVLVGYNYFNGEYSKFTEDISKCYVENIVKVQEENKRNVSNIVGLEAKSNIIYRTNSESNLDYEYIEIKNEVLQYNDSLYISIDDVRNSIRNICRIFRRKWFSNIYISIFK